MSDKVVESSTMITERMGERLPTLERPPLREEVLGVVNSATSSWHGQIERIRESLNRRVSVRNLADHPSITSDQKERLSRWTSFEEGLVSLTELDHPMGLYVIRHDTLESTFQNPVAGRVFTRNEGLAVEDLEEIMTQNVVEARSSAEQHRNTFGHEFPRDREWIERAERELAILRAASKPYTELHPNALNEEDPEERGRIHEEARRIAKDPLAATGSKDGDWEKAKERLRRRKELILPEKTEEAKPEVVIPPPRGELPKETREEIVPVVTELDGDDAQAWKPKPPTPYYAETRDEIGREDLESRLKETGKDERKIVSEFGIGSPRDLRDLVKDMVAGGKEGLGWARGRATEVLEKIEDARLRERAETLARTHLGRRERTRMIAVLLPLILVLLLPNDRGPKVDRSNPQPMPGTPGEFYPSPADRAREVGVKPVPGRVEDQYSNQARPLSDSYPDKQNPLPRVVVPYQGVFSNEPFVKEGEYYEPGDRFEGVSYDTFPYDRPGHSLIGLFNAQYVIAHDKKLQQEAKKNSPGMLDLDDPEINKRVKNKLEELLGDDPESKERYERRYRNYLDDVRRFNPPGTIDPETSTILTDRVRVPKRELYIPVDREKIT